MSELHVISTGKQSTEIMKKTAVSVAHQVDYIHIRERSWTDRVTLTVLAQFHEAGLPKSKLVYNGAPSDEICEFVGGVQLPERHSAMVPYLRARYPGLILGCSVHSIETAREAEMLGAERLIFGHIFETNCKPGVEPRGLEALNQVCAAVSIPVIAIGGIKPASVGRVLASGAFGVAIMSGIMLAKELIGTAALYYNHLNKRR